VLVVLYTITTTLSVVGNVLAIIVFTAGRRSRTDLRWFLVNLAAADLVMAAFCMPFTFTMTMLGHWVFSAPMCPVVLFLQTVSVTASVFTSVAVGIDRYWVVLHPLKSRITKSRSPVVIAAIWIASCTLSSIQLVVGRSDVQTLPGGQQVTAWLGGVTVRTLDLRSRGRGFDFRSGRYQVLLSRIAAGVVNNSNKTFLTNFSRCVGLLARR